MGALRQDVGFALRWMRRNPGFTAVAVVSLGLGLGANTAVFSVLDAVVLRALAVREPERLVVLRPYQDDNSQSFSYPLFRAMAASQTTLEGMFAASDFPFRDLLIRGQGVPDRAVGRLVTGDYFRVLGVTAWRGRVLSTGDDREGAPGVAVISYGFWQRHFGGRDEALGSTIQANRAVVTIVGVTPPEFLGEKPGWAPDVYIGFNQQPLVMANDWRNARFVSWLTVMGRLGEGVSRQRAAEELTALYERNREEVVTAKGVRSFRMEVEPGSRGLRDLQKQFGRPLWVLMAMVALVLLIACVNLGNLLLARAQTRAQEMAIRQALGAGRWRLMRQLLTESVLLSAAGSALGVLLARWSAEGLVALASGGEWRLNAGVDLRMLAFTSAAGLTATLLFGVAPAWSASRVEPIRGGTQRRRWARGFVMTQVALSMLLLAGAGLLVRSLWNLLHQDFGMQPQGVLMAKVPFETRAETRRLHEALRQPLVERLNAMPGVRSAAVSCCGPFDSLQHTVTLSSPGRPMGAGENVRLVHVSAGYFETMGMRMIAGRGIEAGDRATTERVTVLSRSAARRFFGGANPVGQQVSFDRSFSSESAVRVVGVVEDMRFASAREEFGILAFRPLEQEPAPITSIVLRASGDAMRWAGPVKELMKELAPSVAVGEALPLGAWIRGSVRQEQMMAVLAGAFGALALALAAIGLYGVVAYGVARRTREFGIRMALGARRGDVMALVLGEVARIALRGCAIGIGAALASTRVLQSLLFGLTPTDVPTLLVGVGALGVVTLAAGWLPARRAAAVDPASALRWE